MLLARIDAYLDRSGATRLIVSLKLFGNGKPLDEIASESCVTARKMA